MQNGNAFRAFTEKTKAFLQQKTVLDYYGEPLPSDTDREMAVVCRRFMAADADERARFQRALAPDQRSLFAIYGHRAATLSVREDSREWLQTGLVGAAIANYTIPERRNVAASLAVYHHCARKLGINTVDLFAEAAGYVEGEIADILREFGRRSDITLRKYGWRELKTRDGVKYKFNY